jgi:hypothetical protein
MRSSWRPPGVSDSTGESSSMKVDPIGSTAFSSPQAFTLGSRKATCKP